MNFFLFMKRSAVGKRIHIIDDDKLMQSLLKAGLMRRGYDVTLSFHTYDIFDLGENLPDLFLLDVVMPGLNGLETCKWIKANHPNIPVIILSGTPGLNVLAENVKADDFLEKPFELARLSEKIGKCIRRSSRAKHLL
jgi:DNA-binding response OmpR family regulator